MANRRLGHFLDYRACGQIRSLVLSTLGVALAAIGAGLQPTRAQDSATPGGMQIFVTPYLWLSGIDATINTPVARASTVNADVSAVDVLSHLSAVPFMGSIEIRDGPLGLLGDALHVPVGTGLKTRDIAFSGGNAALITDSGTALLLYRALEAPTQYADLGVGFRAWGFSSNLTLNPGILPGASVNRSASWVDPLIGGRYHIDLPSGFLPSGFGLQHPRLQQPSPGLQGRGYSVRTASLRAHG